MPEHNFILDVIFRYFRMLSFHAGEIISQNPKGISIVGNDTLL